MTRDDSDLDLEERFAERRRADELAAPDLDRLLARPRPSPSPAPGRRLALAAAALVFAAAAAALFFRSRTPVRGARDAAALPPAAAELAAWKSPTSSLLSTPGAELWRRVPALVPRVPVFASVPLPQATKGADR